VADIASNSMLYISKPRFSDYGIVYTEPVGPGVHTLSSAGLDSDVGYRVINLVQESCNRVFPYLQIFSYRNV